MRRGDLLLHLVTLMWIGVSVGLWSMVRNIIYGDPGAIWMSVAADMLIALWAVITVMVVYAWLSDPARGASRIALCPTN